MKKTIITVFAFLVLFGFTITGAMAQTWTWQYADVTNGPVDLFAVTPSTDALYGLSGGSAVEIATGTSVTTGETFAAPDLSNIIGIAVGYQGVVYAISSNAFGSCTPVCATLEGQQPVIPTTSGGFTNIAAGKNGKLYVLFETSGGVQYILTGNPPITEGLVVKLSPQSLNLGSKGNWVTCNIQIPGHDIQGIDLASIVITQFVIDQVTYPVNIPVDVTAPSDFGNDKLMVKFVRYNKTTPDDPESFVGALSALLPSGPSKGKVDVTATIQVTHTTDGAFSGEATFKVIVPKAKKQK